MKAGMDQTLQAAPFTLMSVAWRTFTVCQQRDFMSPQDACWAWRSPGPRVLLADTGALSRSVCQLTSTRASMVLSLTSGGLLDRSDSKSYL